MRPTNRKQSVNYSWGGSSESAAGRERHSSWEQLGFFIGMGGGLFGGVRVLIPAPKSSASYCGSIADLSCEQTPSEDNLDSERQHKKR